ncbi:MAG: hypothetical protein J6X55_09345, partial [Victivallales bacterium]|nr:hypothetical protein [Victivallales bacterium]
MATQSTKIQHLLDGLSILKIRRNTQLATIAAAWTFVALMTALLATVVGDAFLHFPTAGRMASFILLALIIIAGLALCLRCAFKRYSMQALAAIAEKAHPEADNTIINAVQMAECDNARPDIIDAILAEHPADPAKFSARSTYTRRLYSHLAYAIPLVLLIFGLTFVLSPERMPIALSRILKPLSDIPPFTETFIVGVTPGNVTIRRGDPITITASLNGIIPPNTIIEWLQPASGTHDATAMNETSDDKKNYAYDFPACFDSFKYRVISNDATSAWMTVTVDNPPGLENWEIRVIPPTYTERPSYTFTAASEEREIIGGSHILFAGAASRPLDKAVLFCDKNQLAQHNAPPSFTQFICEATSPYSGAFSLKLSTPEALETTLSLPIAILPDRLPVISLTDTPTNFKVNRGDSVTITFGAMDDYGIAKVIVEQLLPDNKLQEIASAIPTPEEKRLFRARFSIDTNSFDNEAAVLRFRLRVIETASTEPSRNGLSPIVSISFFSEKEVKKEQERKAKDSEQSLERLLVLQKNALKLTNDTMLKASQGNAPGTADITELYARQKDIRDMALVILQNREMLGALGDTLAGMVNKELLDVLEAIDLLNRPGAAASLPDLQKVATLQTKILAMLTTMGKQGQSAEQQHQEKTDIFAIIQKLAKDQNLIIKQEIAAQASGKVDFVQFANYQTGISKGILAFNDKALASAEEHAEDDFSVQLRRAVDALDKSKSYNHSLDAIEALDEDENLNDALKSQKLALAGIAAAYKLLNDWRVNNAAKTINEAKEVIDEVKETLDKMEEIQAKISEIAHELQKRNPAESDPGLKDDMEKMEKEHEKMLDELEKLANDLYQFPDLPVCNELNSKMKEIYEDVLQAKDSEKLKAVEIAVQKED